jgi:hypothetical protein
LQSCLIYFVEEPEAHRKNMQELVRAIPNVDTLLALEPEELGAKLLFILRSRKEKQFHPGNVKNDLTIYCQNHNAYPQQRLEEVTLALSEAFGWLEAQGLIVHAPDGMNAAHGWRVVSRRAQKFEDEREFAHYAAARHLPKKETLPQEPEHHRQIEHPISGEDARSL